MTAENPEQPEAQRRFTVAAVRQHAHTAMRKSEFILSRAYGLLREPKSEWKQIRDEETTIPNIMVGYVAPLAAIPPVCGAIGAYIFGTAAGGVVIRPALGETIVSAVVTWLVSIALVFILGIIVNAVAQNFDAEQNDLSAQKMAAYSLTPAFLSGIFSLWPPVWWVSLFALAAMAYIMYRGLPILMKAPEERALAYAATVTMATLVAGILLFGLASCVTHT